MSNTSKMWLSRAIALVALGSLAVASVGCNVGPNYKRPAYPAPPAFRGADAVPVESDRGTSIADQQWAQVFREPKLQSLISTALANNYDVRIAAQRILEQQAQVQVTRSQQFPAITVGGTGVGVDIPSLGNSNSISSPITEGTFALNASWTPDFWGLYRKQTEAAREQLLAQVWAQRAVRMTLIESVVTTYVELRTLDKQLDITRQTLKARQDSVDLTMMLQRGGVTPLSDVRQAEQLLFTASSQVPQLEQQIQQQENALSLLLGANPGVVIHSNPNTLAMPPESLPTGLPSELLERRPDIQQAEATLREANANVGVARAQFFPQLSLSASAGIGGDSFPAIFGSNSTVIYGLGQLAQPIFEGGRLRGQLHLSEATKQEMVLSYEKTIAGAFRDVSNALIASKKQRAYREQQEKLVQSAQDATRLARLRYQGGAAAYLEVLTTDSNLFTAQLNLASAEEGEALTLVRLYSALGGGWQ